MNNSSLKQTVLTFIVCSLFFSTEISVAQTGQWVEYDIKNLGSGDVLFDCGSTCAVYTREHADFLLIYNIHKGQWKRIDFKNGQNFKQVQAKGSLVWGYTSESTDRYLIAYYSVTDVLDTLHYEGAVLFESSLEMFTSYGCSKNLAFFITDRLFYVFDTGVGQWQSYDYELPAGYGPGTFYCRDDCIVTSIRRDQSQPFNVVYSAYTRSFNRQMPGVNIYKLPQHGFAGHYEDGNTFTFIGYCAADNQFDMIMHEKTQDETMGLCNFTPKNYYEFPYAYLFGFRRVNSQNHTAYFEKYGYSTKNGTWSIIAFEDVDLDYEDWGTDYTVGGSYAVVPGIYKDDNGQGYKQYLFYSGIDGSFTKITTDFSAPGSNPLIPLTSPQNQISADERLTGYERFPQKNTKAALNPKLDNKADPKNPHHIWPTNYGGPYGSSLMLILGDNRFLGYDAVNKRIKIVDANYDEYTKVVTGNSYGHLYNYSTNSNSSAVYIYNRLNNEWRTISIDKADYISTWDKAHLLVDKCEPQNLILIYDAKNDRLAQYDMEDNNYVFVSVEDELVSASSDNQSMLYDVVTEQFYEFDFELPMYSLGSKAFIVYDEANQTLRGYSGKNHTWSDLPISEEPASFLSGCNFSLVSVTYNNDNRGKYYAFNGFHNNFVELIPESDWRKSRFGDSIMVLLNEEKIYAFDPQVVTSIDEDASGQIVNQFTLHQNYPNPFNSQTVIRYRLGKPAPIKIKVFNVLGQEVASLIDEKQAAGNHQVVWRADNLSSGVYFYRLESGHIRIIKKCLLVK